MSNQVTDSPQTDDPVTELIEMDRNCRATAKNPHLYSVMFGATSLVDCNTLLVLSDAFSRATELGHSDLVAYHLGTAVHGCVNDDLHRAAVDQR